MERTFPGVGCNEKDEKHSSHQVRAPNKQRTFEVARQLFNEKYFDHNSVYDELDFKRCFRMLSTVFNKLREELLSRALFVQRRDVADEAGIDPTVRIISALRVLAHGKSYNESDELTNMSTSSVRQTFVSFIAEVTAHFEDQYLREPTESVLKRILAINSRRKFPRCVRSWDVQHRK